MRVSLIFFSIITLLVFMGLLAASFNLEEVKYDGNSFENKFSAFTSAVCKEGKLPSKTEKESYELEYGKATVEVHVDAIQKGDKVLLVDDLIATAGTLVAAINLIKKLGGEVVECAVIIELPDLRGREKIIKNGCKLFSMVEFEGD